VRISHRSKNVVPVPQMKSTLPEIVPLSAWMRPLQSRLSWWLRRLASRATHRAHDCNRSASACEPPFGVRFWIVRFSMVSPLTFSIPMRLRPRVLPFRLWLSTAEITVPSRSAPWRVRSSSFWKLVTSWKWPGRSVSLRGAALLSGMASMAPCTAQNSVLVLAPTVTSVLSLGADARVENRQAVASSMTRPPVGPETTPGSTPTE
jgi:hypothetical protein